VSAASKRLRIAILGGRGYPSTYGGYETLVRHLAPQWAADGHQVTVYCRSRETPGRKWQVGGVECRWTPGVDSTKLSTLTFGATANIDAALRGYDVALVLNVANGFYLPLLKARGIPSVLNTDGIEWERGKWGKVARRVFLAGAQLSARYADLLVADSQAIGDIWQEKFGVQSRFIPYGGDVVEQHSSDRIEVLGLEPERYVLAVARLIPENNIELLLDALDCGEITAPTVVVGSATASSPIEQRLRELDARGRVKWLGHVSDQDLLLELWGQCGVYVHGHSVGGTNPALLQALGAGAPTLALDTVFSREVIGGDEQLFGGEAAELAARIKEVLADAALRARFREHGWSVIRERYSWPDVIDAYLDALLAACGLAGTDFRPAAESSQPEDRSSAVSERSL
jgi:glycosyltransferase involved in cell wall biosynthesis